jgi:type I restriction enzyme, R subunit
MNFRAVEVVQETNLNEFGRFDDLKESVDQQKAKTYFEGMQGAELPLFLVNIRIAKLLQNFIINGG